MALQGNEHECGQCRAVFSGLGLFEAHQDVDYRRKPVIICAPVQGLGLVQNARGTWCTPEGLAATLASSTRLAAARRAGV
jgi:hypothetical protein